VTYFGVISEHYPGDIKKIHRKSQSGYPVAETKFEPVTFGIQTRILQLESVENKRLAVLIKLRRIQTANSEVVCKGTRRQRDTNAKGLFYNSFCHKPN
jgi:hypothetical protein